MFILQDNTLPIALFLEALVPSAALRSATIWGNEANYKKHCEISKSVDQSIDQSMNKSIYKSIFKSINNRSLQPMSVESNNTSINESIYEY